MATQFKSRKGSSFGDKKANLYGQRLMWLLDKKGGELTPSDIVKDAKRKKSPYHDYFDWEDTLAAKKWRIQQARQLTEGIVKVVIIGTEAKEQRALLSVYKPEDKRPVYVTLETVLNNDNYRNQHIDKILRVFRNAEVLLTLLKSY